MKKMKLITKEEALEKARAQKGQNTGAGRFYEILENADPALVDYLEDQLAVMIQMGTALGERAASLKPGSPEYNQFLQTVQNSVAKTSFNREWEEKMKRATEEVSTPEPKSDSDE
jgi:hypothetical protein